MHVFSKARTVTCSMYKLNPWKFFDLRLRWHRVQRHLSYMGRSVNFYRRVIQGRLCFLSPTTLPQSGSRHQYSTFIIQRSILPSLPEQLLKGNSCGNRMGLNCLRHSVKMFFEFCLDCEYKTLRCSHTSGKTLAGFWSSPAKILTRIDPDYGFIMGIKIFWSRASSIKI